MVLCTACTENTVIVRPVIDIPVNDTAQATGLDTITLSVAHAGASDDIASATFTRGDTIELPNVPFGDDLVVHMLGRIGSDELAYGRTCQFAVRPDEPTPTPHLFFSRIVRFGHMSQQPLPRLGGVAMTYRDGSGLLIGGSFPDPETQAPQALTQIERFDPNTGAYDTLHEVERRIDAAVAIVGTGADSRMVIVGGADPATGLGAEFVEVIEAERDTDRQYERFFEPAMARTELTATTLSDGNAVVIGGLRPGNPTGSPPLLPEASASVFKISVETGPTAIIQEDATLTYPRYAHTATRLTDDFGAAVLVAGGLDNAGKPVAQAELFKSLANDFSTQFTAQMIVPRWQHQAVRFPDGSVLFYGGLTKRINPVTMAEETVVVDELELYSPLDGRFLPAGTLRANHPRIGMSATTLPDGRVLITGGQITIDGPPIDSSFFAVLDPKGGTVRVINTDPLATPRSGHQATALCDGTILVAGGSLDPAPFERYNPVAAGRR
ncbi:MAG TPA: hypothetical protein VIV11_28455 [Kofleriaceae bacterium]